jgi:hypothetical protein
MDTAAAIGVGGLLGASGGALLTGVLSSAHERAQHMRDLTLSASERFLGVHEALMAALFEYQAANDRVRLSYEECQANLTPSKEKVFSEAVAHSAVCVQPVRAHLQGLNSALPKLLVLFANPGKEPTDQPIVAKARSVIQSCSEILLAVDKLGPGQSDPESIHTLIAELSQTSHTRAEEFGSLANSKLRTHRPFQSRKADY